MPPKDAACIQRCLSSHGYFGIAEAEEDPLPVSLGRVRFRKCFCNVTRDFKKFVTKAVGPWTARMYPYFQKIGLGRWARNRMLRKNSAIKFYTWDELQEGEEEEQEEQGEQEEKEEESGATHAETERKRHDTRSHRSPPTSPAAGAGAKRQQNMDIKALQSTGTKPLSLEAHLAQERTSYDKRQAAYGLPPPPRSASSRGSSATSLSLGAGSEISGSGSRVSKSQYSKSRSRRE